MKVCMRAIDQDGGTWQLVDFESSICVPCVGDKLLVDNRQATVVSRLFEYPIKDGVPIHGGWVSVLLTVNLPHREPMIS